MRLFPVPAFTLGAILLSGCAAAPPSYYAMADGSHVADKVKFNVDKTMCLGEMSRAKLASTPVETGNPFIDGTAAVDRDGDAANVMLGCMAGHGYKFVTGQ